MPGSGDQELLPRASVNTLAPAMAGLSFPIVTRGQWQVGCLATTSSGELGEAFFAVAPDGTKYWFDYLVYHAATMLIRPVNTGPGPLTGTAQAGPQPNVAAEDFIQRRKAWMLVTRIEDRFGNALVYHYTAGRLTSIDASDGRQLTVQYVPSSPRIASVSLTSPAAGARTWTYQYGGVDPTHPRLTQVQQPDGRTWSFNLAGLVDADVTPGTAGSCYTPGTPANLGVAYSGSITHPSGLTGTFQVTPMAHGRANVSRECWGVNTSPQGDGYAITPALWYALTLTSRQLTGAGLAPETWSYQYSSPNASWSVDCAGGPACPSTITTDVLDPSGHTTRYTFSNRYDYTESLLLSTDYHVGNASSAILRSEINQYAPPTTGPWPSVIGSNLQPGKQNDGQTEQLFPLMQRTIVQAGDSYLWQAQAFNTFAQATQTLRSNTIAGQAALSEQTTYLNDLPHWVLGLPTETKNLSNNEVVDQYVYDLSNVTLKERWHFGHKRMSYTYKPNGNLASFTDGNSHTTTLDSYMRGVPRSIQHPDGTSESLTVDDFGQITSLTDQAGNTTSYSYDAAGRLTGISYPTGDEQNWLPKTFTYSFVTGAERGLAANHWKRTTTTGSAVAVTYFDALLRPVLSDSAIGASVQASTLTLYDPDGQPIFVSYPAASALSFTMAPASAGITGTSSTYDALGRLTQSQQSSELGALTTATVYLSGARQQVTDPKGNVTTTGYQVFDQPATEAVIQVTAPAGVNQTITRNLYGEPTAIRQYGTYNGLSGDVTKTLAYDAYHRLCRSTEPESASTVLAYDNADNLAWSAAGLAITGTGCGQEQVPAAARTSHTYDAMNRLLTLLPPVGTQSTSYTYDALGHPKTAVSGISTWSATYNKRGMLTGESLQLVGQSAWGIGYAHDTYGSVSLIHYPDGENVSFAPDALGRPTQVGSYMTGVTYFPNGQVAQATLGNGAAYVGEQNTRGLLANLSYGKGGTLQLSEDLAYDENGNITQFTDLAGGPRNKTLGYDALNRLASATATSLWGTETYTYDPLNNLRNRVNGSQTTTYNYDGRNLLASLSGAAAINFVYDPRGNVINKGGAALNFDQKNQLLSLPGASYAYDAAGRRVSKTPVAGTPTYSFYNQAGQLLYQVEPGLSKTTSFAYLGRKLVGSNESVALGAPSSISFDTNPNNGSYTVSWSAIAAATSYVLEESANGGSWTTVYAGSATSAALNGRAGGSYTYRVQGCAASTCGAWTSSATLNVRPALPTVTVPSGTINGSYTVSWTAPAGSTAYDVQERVNGGGWSTIASNTTANSIGRPGTTSGSYTYQVSAKNAYGSRGWAVSGAVTVDTTYGIAPSTPGGFTAPAASTSGSYTVSWSAVGMATSYTLQEKVGTGSWVTIQGSSATSKAISGKANGSYSYRVQACNTNGCSAWSSTQTTTVLLKPATPASITVPATSTGSIAVSWAASATATSYTLQQRLGTGSWGTVYTGAATSSTRTVTAVGSYTYQVQACNASGCSAYKASSAVTVTIAPASAPALTVPATNANGSYTVSWGAITGATSYTLQEQAGSGSWVTTQSSSATNKAISGKANGSYSYRVQACNAGGCGPWSSVKTITVTLAPATPAAPSVSVSGPSYKPVVHVSWAAIAGATSYQVEANHPQEGVSIYYNGPNTSFSQLIYASGQMSFRVKACSATACSGWGGYGYVNLNSGSMPLLREEPAEDTHDLEDKEPMP